MTFALPLALLGLLPWAAVAAYVWARRESTVGVPFVRLWRDRPTPPAGRRSPRRPPWPVVLLLLAAALAVLAASGPSVAGRGRPGDAGAGPAIERLAVRLAASGAGETTAGAALVRVRSPGRATRLVVTTAGRSIVRPLAPGETAAVSLDLPAVGPTVAATLADADGRPLGGRLVVDRPTGYPRVDVVGRPPEVVERVIESYRRVRSAEAGGENVVTVAAAVAFGDATSDAVLVAVVTDRPRGDAGDVGDWRVVDHPLTRAATFPGRSAGGRASAPAPTLPPGDGWRPLVEGGGRVVLAVRSPGGGGRQVWVGLTAAEWRAWGLTPGVVAFVAAAIDWAGGVDPATVGVSVAVAPEQPPATAGRPVALAPVLLLAATLAAAVGVAAGGCTRRLDTAPADV